MRVLAEISEAHRKGASADDIHELFQHAAERLDIMGEEIENEPADARDALRSALATLRMRRSPTAPLRPHPRFWGGLRV